MKDYLNQINWKNNGKNNQDSILPNWSFPTEINFPLRYFFKQINTDLWLKM